MAYPMFVVDGLRSVLSGLSTTEARLVATTALLVAAVVVGAGAVPVVVRRSRRLVGQRVLRGRVGAGVELVAERVPWSVPLRWVVRSLQLVVFGATGLALLAVWGRPELVADVLALAWRTLPAALPFVLQVAVTVALVVGAYVGMDLLEDVIERFSSRADRMTDHQEQVVYRVSQVGLLAVVGIVVLGVWEVNPAGLLVGAGFLGIVVGLAARQTLGSLVAGFVLMLSRPFQIGDWVVIGDHEGIVTDITIVNTRLRNFDGEFVSLPNDRVGDSVVVNRSREGRLRLRIEVGIDYDADPDRAEQVALEAMRGLDAIASQPAPAVIPTRFGDSAVVLELRFWIENPSPPRKWRAVQAVIHAVKDAFEREGVKIPFPQRELAGREEAGGFRVVGESGEERVRETAGHDYSSR